MSVEDIERNIRNQQQKQQNQPPVGNLDGVSVGRSQTPQQLRQLPNQQQMQMPQFPRSPGGPPPGLPPTKGPLFPPHLHGLSQANNVGPKQPVRLPPGFPPMQLMGQHPLAGGPITHHNNLPRPMPHNLPVALNNFAVS